MESYTVHAQFTVPSALLASVSIDSEEDIDADALRVTVRAVGADEQSARTEMIAALREFAEAFQRTLAAVETAGHVPPNGG